MTVSTSISVLAIIIAFTCVVKAVPTPTVSSRSHDGLDTVSSIPSRHNSENALTHTVTLHEDLPTSTIIPDLQPTPRPGIPIAKPNFPRVAIPFVVAMWVISACFLKIALNSWPKLISIIPESCWLILAGILGGLILYLSNTTVLSPLSSGIFFFIMLPPIILDAGYFMPNRAFFDHIGTILLFAVVGTIFNTIAIGLSLWACGLTGVYGFEISLLEILIFSSLISAVDPVAVLAVFEEIHVDQVLYIIVFGESLLNDAVTVVLYNMFDAYNALGPQNIETFDVLSGLISFTVVALGGTSIGICWGFLAGFVTRFTRRVLFIEPVFIFIMGYMAYLNAEAFQMSGILSIMFCGITMKNYVAANVSPKSLTTVKCGLKMLSHSSESIIFIFLGVSTVNDYHEWNTAFVLLTILFCTVYRAIGVVLLTELANYFRLHQLNQVEKFVMSYGGLRGAIAFALVLLIDPNRIPRQPLFATATISVVFFTVFIQGITIKPLVELLKVKREEKHDKTMNERLHERVIDYTMTGIEDIIGQVSSYKVRDKFKQWDHAYIRPLLVRERAGRNEPKIIETYSRLTMKDAIDFANRNPSGWSASTNESFASLWRVHTGTNLKESSDTTLNPAYNLDVGELLYNPSFKDEMDAGMHHLSCYTKRHRRRLSGSSPETRGNDAYNGAYKRNSRRIRFKGSSPNKRNDSNKAENFGIADGVTVNGLTSLLDKTAGDTSARSSEIYVDASDGGISFTACPQNLDTQSINLETATVEIPPPWKTDARLSPVIPINLGDKANDSPMLSRMQSLSSDAEYATPLTENVQPVSCIIEENA